MCRTRMLVQGWLIASVVSTAALAQRPADLAADAVAAQVRQSLGLAAATLQSVVPVATSCGAFEARLAVDGADVTLVAEPINFRTPDFQVLVQGPGGALLPAEAPLAQTYRGRILEIPQAQAALRIDGPSVHGMIRLAAGELRYVQPVREIVPAAPADLHVLYAAEDVLASDHVCGVGEQHIVQLGDAGAFPGGDGGGDAPRGGITPIEIAFDSDVEFFQANGSSVSETVRDIEFVLNGVDLLYQQLNIAYIVRGIIVRTAESDPYSSTDADILLCSFRSQWNSVVTIPRDTAHLMTGKNLDGTTIGLAWVGVVCNVAGPGSSDCPVDANKAYGLSQSRFSTNDAERFVVTAHELGHNWGACHCNQSSCTGGGADADCGIMCSSVGGCSGGLTNWGSRATAQIGAFRSSRTCLNSLLANVFVDSGSSLGENGSAAFPYNTVREGAWSVLRSGGTLNILPATYSEAMLIQRPMTIQRWGSSGTVRIGG
jgi:hypothetical protein